MDLTITVRDGDGRSADVWIEAPADALASSVLRAVRDVVGLDPAVPLSVGGRSLDEHGLVIDSGLCAGAVVSAGVVPPRLTPPVLSLVKTGGCDAGRRWPLPEGVLTIGRSPDCDICIDDGSVSRLHARLEIADDSVVATDLGTANGTALIGGTSLRVGGVELRVEPTPTRPSSRQVVHRAPRQPASQQLQTVRFPAPPVPPQPPRVPLLAAIVPTIAGLILALAVHQWEFLAFTALSPVMILGQAASDRRAWRRDRRRSAATYAAATRLAARELEAGLAGERDRRFAAAPDLGRLAGAAETAGPELWQRGAGDTDLLVLRLGRGDLPSEVQVEGGPAATAEDVPVHLPLTTAPLVGVVGPDRRGIVRALLVQAAVLHGPTELRIMVLAPGGSEVWRWARWLPHVADARCPGRALMGFDAVQVERLRAGLTAFRGWTLVVVDAGGPELAAAVDEVPPRTAVLCLAENVRALPNACRPIVDHGDQVADDIAERVARALAPLSIRAGGSEWTPPRAVSWSELNPTEIRREWAEPPGTTIPLGLGRSGVVSLDLVADGPHMLVAGTTGSGKSELLIGLIASLAARNRPDRLGFVLVDHKGGAAFGACRALPHVLGLITDLDRAGTSRALASLGAEIRRREAAFAASGVSDLEQYVATAPATPVARVVIVVDEFATLVEEQPGFVDGLVGIAQRGRSLGIHLILATQRPEGVVSADIRANVRLRVCLGVARESESRDVLDSPAAASISRSTPGRGYLRLGPGELQEFQAARVTAARPAREAVRVRLAPPATLGDPPDPEPEAAGPSELDALIAVVTPLAAELGCAPIPAPWLPPLPAELPLTSVPAPADPRQVGWGLVDDAANGRQPALTLDPIAGGLTVIVGSAGSGRTTALVSAVTAIAARLDPGRLQIWAVDGGHGLSDLAALPHCGAVVPVGDGERVEALLSHLERLVTERRAGGADHLPGLLLAIDGWAAAADRLEALAENTAVGLHLLVAGGRSLLTVRFASHAREKVALRLADPTDLLLVAPARRDLPDDFPPGRGLRKSDGALVQVAVADPAARASAMRWSPPPVRPP
ncbi:MAG: FHA domain-containing protein, partial [Frankiaceae bacterium]|nr:FHA domain-containing protein [Frankiaceae bacterium]